MIKIMIVLSLVILSVSATTSMACPTTSLMCSLAVVQPDGSSAVLNEATSKYVAAPLHCMARVAIASPVEYGVMFYAAASTDESTALFVKINGEPDVASARFGLSSKEPLTLSRDNQIFSCTIK